MNVSLCRAGQPQKAHIVRKYLKQEVLLLAKKADHIFAFSMAKPTVLTVIIIAQ